jgi:hypothetical protein
MKRTLQIIAGTDEKRTVSLEPGRYTIGRGNDAHIQISSHQVSRKHAELIVEAETVTLLDCGSANGTAVNGRFVTESRLADGDQILIGEIVMEYRCTQAEVHPGRPPAKAPPPPRSTSFYASATKLINDKFRPRALWPFFSLLFAVTFVGIALAAGLSYRSLLRDRLTLEALQRAQGLVKYLAEKNREDLRSKTGFLLDVDSVLREKGVREALIVSNKRRILAPISRLDQTVNDPFTTEALAQNNDRSIAPGPRAPDGTQVFVHPIRAYDDTLGKYQVLGVAKIVFAADDAVGSLAEADRLLYLLLAAALLLSFLFGWVAARALSSPLVRLAEQIHRWRAGQIYEKEKPPYRDFEPLYQAVDQALEESQR